MFFSGKKPRSIIPEMHNGVSLEKDVYASQGNVANVPTKQLAMTKTVENGLALHQSKRYNAILRLAQVANSHHMYQTRKM